MSEGFVGVCRQLRDMERPCRSSSNSRRLYPFGSVAGDRLSELLCCIMWCNLLIEKKMGKDMMEIWWCCALAWQVTHNLNKIILRVSEGRSHGDSRVLPSAVCVPLSLVFAFQSLLNSASAELSRGTPTSALQSFSMGIAPVPPLCASLIYALQSLAEHDSAHEIQLESA
ncbi:unnamed protein product [Dovyalis caffra]|uniref:Uncharacterized protein n=1 Tax=Dovyalis caffra TaxID=77055 RepID=A0AAV1RS90_9ROSI|nr:unnamed protein product [Dovyalis caffra]